MKNMFLRKLPALSGAALILLSLLPATSEGMPNPKSRVHILGTGGTISGVAPERIMMSGYRSGSLTLEEMLAGVPEVEEIADVTHEQVINVGSGRITDQELLALGTRIITLIREEPEIDGFVVTHGTGTLEETAYFLNLTVRTDKPIVVVGAMRPYSGVSSDAHLNLYNAVRVAAAPESRGRGALIVLNDEINSAREGTKTDTYRVHTFNSREYGLLGYADPDRVVFYRETLRRHTYQSEFEIEGLTELPSVSIVAGGYQMADATPFEAVVDAGKVEGIVLASSAGVFNSAREEAHAAGVAIVLSDRKGGGRVLLNEERLAETGVVTADSLRPQKARILLKVALTKTRDPAELQRIFNTY